MKWSKAELNRHGNQDLVIDETLTWERDCFATDRLRELKNVVVTGSGRYDASSQRLEVDLTISGEMIVPCAVTLEDVEVPFETSSTEIFSFLPVKEDQEEVHVLKDEVLDLRPVIEQLILLEVPLKGVKDGAQYPKGEGWEVVREEEHRLQKRQEIDPRLAKLKEFKVQEDD